MKAKLSIFRRFAIVIFSLITILGLLFIIITYLATTNYHDATTQLLNKDVAKHVAKFTASFTQKGIDTQKADSVFHNAMVMNPNAEVYFLDTSGTVIYFHKSEIPVREKKVDLAPIKKYLQTHGEKYLKGTDPRKPGETKIFSAASVGDSIKPNGYIYVVLGSTKTQGIMSLLFDSHILNLSVKAFIVIIILSLIFSGIYLRRLRKNFQQMILVLERFERGDYSARFALNHHDELQPVTQAFNKMADLLSTTISKLKLSEQNRQNFFAIISHDLRTPLSIARGYTETLLLKRESGDITKEEQEQYSRLIYSKMLQIENMVKQLFELSKLDAGEFKTKEEPFVLSEIVQEAVDTFQLAASEKNINLKCSQCLHHVWIKADISMMERVIQNLVENALKSTNQNGSIEVSINVDKDSLIFQIVNEGPPLSAELLQWVNDFKEPGASSEQRPQKQGLGLLIVQKILHLHQTNLHAYVQDKMNVFTFRLPVYRLHS
jgi:signal transduction histidine kinase